MNLLPRLVIGVVLRHAGMALSGLLAVFSVILLSEELRSAGEGAYDTGAALRFVLLSLPAEACRLVPAAALLGAVLGLGRLADSQEIVALQAAGVSPLRITLWATAAGAVLAAATTGFAEYVASPLACRAQEDRAVAQSEGHTLSTSGGLWARDGSTYAHASTVEPDGSLGDVSVFELHGLQLRRYTRASRVVHDGTRWVATEAIQVDLEKSSAIPLIFNGFVVGGFSSPDEVKSLALQPEDLSLGDLRRNIADLRQRGENPFRFEVAFWQRAGLPMVTVVMVLVAMPFVLHRTQRVSSGARTLVAVLLGLGLQMVSDTFHQFGLVYGLPPLLIGLFPMLVVLAIAPLLMRRLRPV